MIEIIKPGTKFDFLGRRKPFYIISAILLTISLGAMVFRTINNGSPFNYGIDFTGGTEIQLSFNEDVPMEQVRGAMATLGFGDAEVQSVQTGGERTNYLARIREQVTLIGPELAEKVRQELVAQQAALGELAKYDPAASGDRIYLRFGKEPDQAVLGKVFSELNLNVRSIERTGRPQDYSFTVHMEELQTKVAAHFQQTFGGKFAEVARVQVVGPKAGSQLRNAGILAAAIAMLLIIIYVAVRYDFRFSAGALGSLFHDPLITMGCFSIFWWDFSLSAIAALLTILGYSINDTIVIFDRIREVLRHSPDRDLVKVSNQALNETLSRTILTTTGTLLTVFALLIFGGSLLREFMIALAIGMIVGVYSTIGVAASIMVDMDKILPRLQALLAPGKAAASKAAAATTARSTSSASKNA